MPDLFSLRRLSVLLIEDNTVECLLAEEVFEWYSAQVSVTIMQDGASALTWLQIQADQQALPDVVILDVNMPGLTGFDVLQAIRHDPQWRHLHVVMLSHSEDRRNLERAVELVANSYVVKAPDFMGFVRQIDTLVSFWGQVRFLQHPSPM